MKITIEVDSIEKAAALLEVARRLEEEKEEKRAKNAMIDGINAVLWNKAMAYERLMQQSRQNQGAKNPT